MLLIFIINVCIAAKERKIKGKEKLIHAVMSNFFYHRANISPYFSKYTSGSEIIWPILDEFYSSTECDMNAKDNRRYYWNEWRKGLNIYLADWTNIKNIENLRKIDCEIRKHYKMNMPKSILNNFHQ